MITITNFSAMTPAITPKRLQDGQSEAAVNCDFSRGDLRPMRANAPDPSGLTLPAAKSIYLHRVEGVRFWYRRPHAASFVAGLIPEDSFLTDNNPVFWTVDQAYTPAWPRITTSKDHGETSAAQFPQSSFRLGVPTPFGAPTVSEPATPPGEDSQGVGYRMWAYTLVNIWGQEGPMSLPSAPVLTASPPGVTISGLNNWTLGTGDSAFRAITKRRIYRAVTGVSQQTYWQYVGETTGSSFDDDATDANLGDECPTRSFKHPKQNLRGLTAMPNGILAAFRGQDLWFSHPYHPYAWPEEYVLTTDFRISALAAMGGSNMLVGTRGHPYICTGADPLSMSLSRLDISQSCIDTSEGSIRRTMVSLGAYGAAYASPDGLVIVPASGSAEIVTRDVFTQAQWQWMTSGSVYGYAHEGEYVCCCRLPANPGPVPAGLGPVMDRMGVHQGCKAFTLIVDIARRQARFSDYFPSVLGVGHADLRDDALYFAEEVYSANGTPVSWRIVRWNPPTGASLRYYWRSKPIIVPRTNYGTVRVIADPIQPRPANFVPSPNPDTDYNAAHLAMTIEVDRQQVFRSPLWGFGPWRLPSGFTGREWTIILEGTVPVQSIIIGGEE